MPELPEVEHVRRGLDAASLSTPVAKVWRSAFDLRTGAHWARPVEFTGRLRGARPTSIARRGKYLLWNFDGTTRSRPNLTALIHLGMTGRCAVKSKGDKRENHTHVSLSFEDGRRFDFVDPRRFGGFVVAGAEEILRRPPICDLGPEPLGSAFGAELFVREAGSSRRVIRQALLDQRLLAGLGNIYVSEALHRARIPPLARCHRIRATAWERLAHEVVKVLEEALERGGTTLRDYRRVDGSRGENQHALKAYGRAGKRCVQCAATLVAHSYQGRSGVHCPKCQTSGPGGWVS
jgi:formamidopyrimidine-DNA glycosylase